METVKIIVKDSLATVFNLVDLVSGTSGLICEFTFNTPWKNLIKNVIFRAGSTTKTILDIKDNKVEIPKMVLEEVGSLLEVGIEGMSVAGRLEISTIFAVMGRIRQGADTDNTPNAPDTWQQIYITALEAKDLAEQAIINSPTRYELINPPYGTLFDIKEKELRIMCPHDTQWTFQSSGSNADKYSYYIGLKIFAPTNDIYSFKEDLAKEISDNTMYYFENNPFAGIDDLGRKYSIVWLPVAKYDTETQVWNYYGAQSTDKKYIGWYYRADWYDQQGIRTHTSSIRINLTNEECHTNLEPYYMQQISIEQIIQPDDSILILDGGSATKNIIIKE